MPDNTVDLAVRWSEAGSDIPAKTRASLQALDVSANETAGTIGDRLAKAFTDVERREPTYAVRRLRFAMDELTASALGMAGPFGRVIATVGMMQFGGAIAAVGGLALEFKSLLGFSDQLDKSLEKLNDRFAGLGGAGSASLAQARQIGEMEPEQPSWYMRLFARLGTLGTMSLSPLLHMRPEESDEGDLNQAIQEGFGAQQATFANAQQLNIDQFHRQHAAVLKRHGEQLRRDFLERVSREDPSQAIPDLLKRRAEFEKAGAQAGAEWAKAFLEAVAHAPGPIDRAPFKLGAATGPLGGGVSLPQLQTFNFGGLGEAILAAHAAQPFGFHPDETLRPRGGLFAGERVVGNEKGEQRSEQAAERNAERMATVIGREIGPVIALVAGIGGGGGGRAAVAGLGGILSATAGLRDAKGMALLGSTAPVLDLAGGLLSGLSSLFGGGHHEVKINAFSEQALQQMRETRGDPLTLALDIIAAIGANPRTMQQQLGRLSRAGVITRFP